MSWQLATCRIYYNYHSLAYLQEFGEARQRPRTATYIVYHRTTRYLVWSTEHPFQLVKGLLWYSMTPTGLLPIMSDNEEPRTMVAYESVPSPPSVGDVVTDGSREHPVDSRSYVPVYVLALFWSRNVFEHLWHLLVR